LINFDPVRILLNLLFLLLLCKFSFGQCETDSLYSKKTIGVSLIASIKYPGMGIAYTLPDKHFYKEKKGKIKEKMRRWSFESKFYYHKHFHNNLMLNVGREFIRMDRKKHFFFISKPEIGVSRTFYNDPSYKIENGVAVRRVLAGDFYLNFNYRFGFGKDWRFSKDGEVFRMFSTFGLLNYVPYNNLYYSRPQFSIHLEKFIR